MRFAAAFAATLLIATAAGWAGPSPASRMPVGGCTETRVVRVEPRLQGMPDSGVVITYADGATQVSYAVVPAMRDARPGDPVQLCVQSRPKNCPKGDDRGTVFLATNRRTHQTWTAADSSHMCGGA